MKYTNILQCLGHVGIRLDLQQKDLLSLNSEYFIKKLEHYVQDQLFLLDPDAIPSIPVHLPALGKFTGRNEFDKPVHLSEVLLIPASKYIYHAKKVTMD